MEILAFTLEEFVKGEKKRRRGSCLILLILFYLASSYSIFGQRTSQLQLNPLYYVEFSDIYPLRRSAAFKITEFRPSNKVEKALSDRKEVLCCSEAQKRVLKKISAILIIPH